MKFSHVLAMALLQTSNVFGAPEAFGVDLCMKMFSEVAEPEKPMKFTIGNSKNVTRLLIVAAMDVEDAAISEALGNSEKLTISDRLGIQAKVFRRNGRELVVVKTGIGVVNAGVATALVADRLDIDGVILLGVAGAVRPGLEIGQIVVGSKVLQHDSVFSGSAGPKFMAPGQPFVSLPAEQRADPIFDTDKSFNSWIARRLEKVSKAPVAQGVVLSGNEFVGNSVRKSELAHLNSGAMVVEMEAAGVATVAARLQLPFAVVKTVADRLNPDGSVSEDYNTFIHAASVNAGLVVRTLWEGWTTE